MLDWRLARPDAAFGDSFPRGLGQKLDPIAEPTGTAFGSACRLGEVVPLDVPIVVPATDGGLPSRLICAVASAYAFANVCSELPSPTICVNTSLSTD